MIKSYKKLLDVLRTERALKYSVKKHHNHAKNFPNLACFAFDEVGTRISLFGRFEYEELKVLEQKVFSKIDCANSSSLDIGSHIGNHSVFFAGFFSKVYAFEPAPDNYYLLKFNTRAFENIKIFNFGSSDINESKDLYIAADSDLGRNTLFPDRVDKTKINNPRKFKVELKNLDNLLNENEVKKISFIKIDVEGYEYKTLLGLRKTIAENSPIIVIEQWTDAFDEIKKTTESIEFLRKNSYNFFYEPEFFQRRKSKNKFLRAIYRVIYVLQILLNIKKVNSYRIKEIKTFEVKPYPMIIASKKNLIE